jgi:hypothetical protein
MAISNFKFALANGQFAIQVCGATMAWALVLLAVVLGALGALRPSGRQREFKRIKEEE